MPDRFTALIRKYEEPIIRSFADEIYNDRQTDLPHALSYEQLINFLPDFLDDLARLLDGAASDDEMAETARRLRSHAQVRFHQGVLLDEVTRELTVFRRVFSDFLCREGGNQSQENASEICAALCQANRFVDELMVQAIVVYAASMRPPVKTRNSVWPPPRRRKSDFIENGNSQ